MGGEGQLLRRIPRIKFPKRHSSSSGSQGQEPAAATTTTGKGKIQFSMASGSDVPPSINDTTAGGKASLQPKRTPVTDREIEAVMKNVCNFVMNQRTSKHWLSMETPAGFSSFCAKSMATDGNSSRRRAWPWVQSSSLSVCEEEELRRGNWTKKMKINTPIRAAGLPGGDKRRAEIHRNDRDGESANPSERQDSQEEIKGVEKFIGKAETTSRQTHRSGRTPRRR
ncbi:hypothetical protein LINGRAHAP2_LOCUS17197 [Linum grandiflorum]